jgi:hypothetical protein
VQRELDRLGSNLQQVEAYNESMKSEIAVTRRAAYAAEEAMQKLEKEKQHQDYLIDDMQVGTVLAQLKLANSWCLDHSNSYLLRHWHAAHLWWLV